MSRFSGKLGYAMYVEEQPGVWVDSIVEKPVSGDILSNGYRYATSQLSINDDLTLNNRFSIIATPFARENYKKIKYIVYDGERWKVTSVDKSQYPRLIITVGGVYDAEQA